MKPLSFNLSCAFTCSIFLLVGLSLATTPAIPPATKDLVGVYVGHSNYDDFYRLELRSDFTGYFAQVAPPRSSIHKYGVSTYRITHWSLKDFDLVFSLAPAGAKAEGIELKGRVGAFDVLRLEASGTTNRWQRKLVLYSEAQTRVSNEETREAIERVEEK
jgi:hypothetical protein